MSSRIRYSLVRNGSTRETTWMPSRNSAGIRAQTGEPAMLVALTARNVAMDSLWSRVTATSSFAAEGHHGIDPRSAARGQVTGGKADRGEEEGPAREGHGISRAHAIELTREGPRHQ